MLRELGVDRFVELYWVRNNPMYRVRKDPPCKKEDTYIVIFGGGQDKALEAFLEAFPSRYRLIFRSERCENLIHQNEANCTVFVFEPLP